MPPNQSPAPSPIRAPSVKLTSGANPRGVAIARPASTAPRLTPVQKAASNIVAARVAPLPSRSVVRPGTGVTPVQAAAANLGAAKRASIPDVHNYAPVTPRNPSGGGGLLGAIEGAPLVGGAVHGLANLAAAGARGIGTEAGRFASGAAHFPTQFLQGAEGIGSAEIHDLTHGHVLGALAPELSLLIDPNSQSARAIRSGISADPIVQSIKQGSLSPIAHDPFGTAMDATGIYGAVGKTAGLVGRAAGLADTAAETRPIVAGADMPGATVTRLPSKNLLTTSANKAMFGETTGGLQNAAATIGDPVQRIVEDQAMRREVAADTAASTGETRALGNQIAQDMKDVKPGKTEAGIVKHVVGFGLAPEQLPRLGAEIERRLENPAAGERPLTGQFKANAQANLSAHRAAAEHGINEPALERAAAKARQIINDQTDARIGLGDLSAEEATQGLAKRVAMAHFPDDARVLAAHNPEWLPRLAASVDRPAAYVAMRTADRAAPSFEELTQGKLGRSTGSTNADYTGASLEHGTDTPGWEGLMNSMLASNQRIGDLKLQRDFLGKWSIGGPHATQDDARAAADQFTSTTGHKADVMRNVEDFHAVPHAAADELQKQLKLNRPEGARKVWVRATRNFKNTVLPYSIKLPVMHNTEMPVRTALAEGGTAISPLVPAAKARWDIVTARKILDAADQIGARARLEHQLVPGSGVDISGGLTDPEDVGRPTGDLSPFRLKARAVGNTYNRVPGTLLKFQRMQARPADMAALGRTARALMEAEGHSPLAAFGAARDNATRIAHDLAFKPGMANLAERRLEREMGQYKSFTARQRMVHQVSPFAPWYRSAAKLLYDPRVAPLTKATALDYVRAHQKQINAEHAGMPGDMQGALPLGGGNVLDVGKYLPLPPGQNVQQTVLGQLLPQVQGPAAAAIGDDPFWKPLKSPGHGGQFQPPFAKGAQQGDAPLPNVGEALAEEFLGPAAAVSRAVAGGGKTLYSGSVPVLHALSGGLIGHDWRHSTKPGGPLEHLTGVAPWVDSLVDPFQPTHWASSTTGAASPQIPFTASASPISDHTIVFDAAGRPHAVTDNGPEHHDALHRHLSGTGAA